MRASRWSCPSRGLERSDARPGRCTGFSLLEVLIVVILLGIVAAMTIPVVAGYQTQADETSLRSDLALMRSAIELFAADHNGAFPALIGDGTHAAGSPEAFVAHMTQYSNADGEVSQTKGTDYPFGPYLPQGVPNVTVGPLAGGGAVKVTSSASNMDADGSPTMAWKYSTVTGQIICNTQQLATDGTTRYDRF